MSTYITEASEKSEEKRSYADDQALLERARKCFKLVCDAESRQREREKEDLLFQIPENQWPAAARAERGGGLVGGVATPPRPMLSISLLAQPQQLVYNQFTKARLGVNVHPVSEDAGEEQAEVIQGLYRRIERDSNADQARGWALLRALAAGRGWYRVGTKYDEDSDPKGPAAWDQEITIERILHQETVYMDPSATKPDYSDAKWALVTAWKDEEDFRREFPNAKASSADATDWRGWAQDTPEWVRNEPGNRAFLVAEYWWKEITREEIRGPKGKPSRERETVEVYCAKLTGSEVLEITEWNGRYIPIVPVIGRELIPVDGDRRIEGMIRPARDGQMLYNYAASTLVERMALEPKTPFIGAEGQFEGLEDRWQQANTRNLPYLEYKPITLGDKPAPPPQRAQIDQSGMSLALLALQEGKNFVQATTAVFEPSLGEAPQNADAHSGRAILALQSQTDAGTSHYMQNLASVSMRYEALVVLDLMPAIYDRPGRVTRILGGEDEPQTVMLGAPFVRDAKGLPLPARPNDPSAKTFDLRKGRYSISVDIGKSHQTRLEAGQQFLTEVVSADPTLMQVVGDLLFKFRDEPGAKEIADRLRKSIAAKNPGLIDDGQQTSAEQAQAQLQGAQQQLQVLGQQLQQAAQIIQTKQVEQQAKVQIAQLQAQIDQTKIQSEQAIAQMNNAAKIEIARISAASASLDARAAAAEEFAATGLKVQAEIEQTKVQQDHEQRMQHKDMAHEVAMAAAGGQTMTLNRTQGQDSQQEEGQEMSQGQSSTPQPAEDEGE